MNCHHLVIGLGSFGTEVSEQVRLLAGSNDQDKLGQILSIDLDLETGCGKKAPTLPLRSDELRQVVLAIQQESRDGRGWASKFPWFPDPSRFAIEPRTLFSTGHLRPLGRLAFHIHFKLIHSAIRSKLERLPLNRPRQRIEISLVASLGGGLGSGMIFDVAHLCYRMAQEAGISLYVALPPADRLDETFRRDQQNAYAFIQELRLLSLQPEIFRTSWQSSPVSPRSGVEQGLLDQVYFIDSSQSVERLAEALSFRYQPSLELSRQCALAEVLFGRIRPIEAPSTTTVRRVDGRRLEPEPTPGTSDVTVTVVRTTSKFVSIHETTSSQPDDPQIDEIEETLDELLSSQPLRRLVDEQLTGPTAEDEIDRATEDEIRDWLRQLYAEARSLVPPLEVGTAQRLIRDMSKDDDFRRLIEGAVRDLDRRVKGTPAEDRPRLARALEALRHELERSIEETSSPEDEVDRQRLEEMDRFIDEVNAERTKLLPLGPFRPIRQLQRRNIRILLAIRRAALDRLEERGILTDLAKLEMIRRQMSSPDPPPSFETTDDPPPVPETTRSAEASRPPASVASAGLSSSPESERDAPIDQEKSFRSRVERLLEACSTNPLLLPRGARVMPSEPIPRTIVLVGIPESLEWPEGDEALDNLILDIAEGIVGRQPITIVRDSSLDSIRVYLEEVGLMIEDLRDLDQFATAYAAEPHPETLHIDCRWIAELRSASDVSAAKATPDHRGSGDTRCYRPRPESNKLASPVSETEPLEERAPDDD